MTRQEFMHGMELTINYYGAVPKIEEDTQLSVFDGWDSLTRTMVHYWIVDNLKIRLTVDDYLSCKTMGDLMNLLPLEP